MRACHPSIPPTSWTVGHSHFSAAVQGRLEQSLPSPGGVRVDSMGMHILGQLASKIDLRDHNQEHPNKQFGACSSGSVRGQGLHPQKAQHGHRTAMFCVYAISAREKTNGPRALVEQPSRTAINRNSEDCRDEWVLIRRRIDKTVPRAPPKRLAEKDFGL